MRENPLFSSGARLARHLPCRRYLEGRDRPRRLWAQTFAWLTVFLGLVYLVWVSGLVWKHLELSGCLFLVAEIICFLLLVLLAANTCHRRYHRPQGLIPLTDYSVDIFIPCCGEPLEVIRATLRAAARISYDFKETYVLDDGASPEVARLAQSLGFHYLSRPLSGVPLAGAKSGNLNFGLNRSQGELILVLDADQQSFPDIVSRLAGFFQVPRLAYVQSKQDFFLPQEDPFYNSDKIFYEALQLSNDHANAVVSCGSGVMYRREALKSIGGFATWNIVEDFTTSYELLSRGWKGIYFPFALSRGLVPLTLTGVCRQRFQWCLDTMRLFFWDNPLVKSGLTLRQRLHFLIIMVSYLVSGLAMPIFYVIPLLVYCQGDTLLLDHETSFWILRGAYLAAMLLMFRCLFFRKEAWKQFKMLGCLFPVYGAAMVAALVYRPGRKPIYRINNHKPFSQTATWWLLAPQLFLIGLHLSLPFISLWLGWALPRLIVFNAIFSAFTVWILAHLVLASLTRPQWRAARDPRLAYA